MFFESEETKQIEEEKQQQRAINEFVKFANGLNQNLKKKGG